MTKNEIEIRGTGTTFNLGTPEQPEIVTIGETVEIARRGWANYGDKATLVGISGRVGVLGKFFGEALVRVPGRDADGKPVVRSRRVPLTRVITAAERKARDEKAAAEKAAEEAAHAVEVAPILAVLKARGLDLLASEVEERWDGEITITIDPARRVALGFAPFAKGE
jgi:hypothetical protein